VRQGCAHRPDWLSKAYGGILPRLLG
jgi:hypothetical protein